MWIGEAPFDQLLNASLNAVQKKEASPWRDATSSSADCSGRRANQKRMGRHFGFTGLHETDSELFAVVQCNCLGYSWRISTEAVAAGLGLSDSLVGPSFALQAPGDLLIYAVNNWYFVIFAYSFFREMLRREAAAVLLPLVLSRARAIRSRSVSAKVVKRVSVITGHAVDSCATQTEEPFTDGSSSTPIRAGCYGM